MTMAAKSSLMRLISAPLAPRISPFLHSVRHLGYRIPPPINWGGVRVVPESSVYIVERFGKYSKTLSPGLHVLIPIADRIAYVQSLKEDVISILCIVTQGETRVVVEALLYFKVLDPLLASYAIEDPVKKLTQLAQQITRREVHKWTLNKVDESHNLKEKIVMAINDAAKGWGLKCLRCEIGDKSLADATEAIKGGNYGDKTMSWLRKEARSYVSASGGFIAVIIAAYMRYEANNFENRSEEFQKGCTEDLATIKKSLIVKS